MGGEARQEIRDSIRLCRNSGEIAAEVERLAGHFRIGKDRIYAITADLRPKRKTRSDKGRRAFDVDQSEDAKLLYGWIDMYGITAAEAVNMARDNGMNVPIEFTTLNSYLRADGLGVKQRRNPTTPHRRFEASRPGEIFQFDMSGLKTRWFDRKTRRIITVSDLDVSKNHPNTNPNRVKVWRFSLLDDFSRRTFIRYYAVDKANSTHVVDFLLRAYSVMGVPETLYTDNDSIIVGGRNKRATEILNKSLRDRGGYQVVPHLPGNARATGKVERLHQTVEQEEKLIGIYLAERGELSIDILNERLATGFMNRKNNKIHSTTKATPMERWQSTLSVVRSLDYDELRSAFMADDFSVRLRGDATFRLKGEIYQLPTTDRYPFAAWAAEGRKIKIVFPDEHDFFTIIDDDLNEYDISKRAAVADTAGEFKATAETRAQRIRKEARAVAKADAKRKKESGSYTRLPYFDNDFADMSEPGAIVTGLNAENVARFPKPQTPITAADIAEAAPGRTIQHNPAVNFWEAVGRFNDRFASKAECKQFMDSIFESRDETCWLLESEISERLDERRPVRLLKVVS